MFVSCECCVLSGRGLCDELISRPEESCRVMCVSVYAKPRMERPWPGIESRRRERGDIKDGQGKLVCVESLIGVLLSLSSYILEVLRESHVLEAFCSFEWNLPLGQIKFGNLWWRQNSFKGGGVRGRYIPRIWLQRCIFHWRILLPILLSKLADEVPVQAVVTIIS
jgi:hypothetical protein